MKARIIQAVAEASRDLGCFAWRVGDRVCDAVGRITLVVYRAANAAPSLIDPDRLACRECDEPGGMHIDCDDLAAGKWTATERAQIEAYHAAQDVKEAAGVSP